MKKYVTYLLIIFMFLISQPIRKAGKSAAEVTKTGEVTKPLKITSHGPTGEVQGQVQIKIAFEKPLIPLTTLSDEERARILEHFVLEPDIEGKFRFLGTSTVAFEPAHSLTRDDRFGWDFDFISRRYG